MHKYINGKYHKVNHTHNAAENTGAGKPVELGTDAAKISAAAAKIIQDRADIDWSGLAGTGKDGQVTKKDAQAFLAKQSGGGAAAE